MRAASSRTSIRVRVLPSRDVLGHAQLVIRLRRDLWQVRHAQHLALAGELVQLTADHLGHGATHAGIDFVEDQAGEVSGLDGRHLQRQADAREFAARGDLCQRPRRLSRVGADEELDLVVAVRREHRRILRLDARGEHAARHAQRLHEASDLAVQCGRRLLPPLR